MRCKNKACPLYGKRQEVPYDGNSKAKIVFIGESPGAWEEKKKKPFVGESGKLARECCADAGVNYGDLFIGNSARCRIIKNELTPKEIRTILASCRPNLERAIRHIKPRAIVCSGDYAMQTVLRKSGITKARGQWAYSNEFNAWVLPVFHPAYILRNMALRGLLVNDLIKLREFQKNKYKPLETSEKDTLGYREVASLDFLLQRKEPLWIGLDTETQGVDWMNPNFLLISVSVSDEKGKAYQMVLHEEGTEKNHDFVIQWNRKLEHKRRVEPSTVYVKRAAHFDQKVNSLSEVLKSRTIKKFMANGNFDCHAFDHFFQQYKKTRFSLGGYVMDIQAAAHLIDENLFKRAELRDMQFSFSDMRHDYKKEFESKYDKGDMLKALSDGREDFKNYACADADVTRQIGMQLRANVLKEKKLARYFVQFEMPALNALYVMERNGAHIDLEQLPKLTEDFKVSVATVEKQALDIVPAKVKKAHEKNGLSLSRKELIRDCLFGRGGFGFTGVKRTKGNVSWSVDKETRLLLLDQPGLRPEATNFIELFNEYSEDYTILTRYLNGFKKFVKQDGRIHSSYSLTVAVTARSSSRNPNMQNNPKRSKQANKIRRLISAPPGYLLLAVDYQQSELRFAAQLSGDPEMRSIFMRNEDIHTATAMDLGGYTNEAWARLSDKEKDEKRRSAKAVNFGLLYLMTANGFVRYAKKEYGLTLSLEQAELWISIFFRKYRRLPAYHEKTIEFGRMFGYVESPLGRRRHLPELKSQDKALRREAEKQAVNHPIQSASSDVCLLCASEILKRDYDEAFIKLILFIHDELVFEVKDCSKAMDYARQVKEIMENPPLEKFDVKMRVPLVAELKLGSNLGELKNLTI